GIACLAAVVTGRLTRRLVELASLLRLPLAFPGRAPSRVAVALGGRRATDIDRLLRADLRGMSPNGGATHLLRLVAALNRHDRLTR
ncbi:hypothetical protein ABTB39_19855, partial [Acinetobacter baumannii]